MSYAVRKIRGGWGVFQITPDCPDGKLVSKHKTSKSADAAAHRLLFA